MPLVAHWKLDDNAASTTVVATVGSNGTLTGGDTTATKHTTVSWRGGSIASAFDFNGSDDAINIASSSINYLEVSFSCWVKLDAVPAILCGRSDSDAERVRVVDDTTIGIRTNVSEITFTVPSLGTTDPHHIVVTRDNLNQFRVYVDGVESATGAQTLTNNLSPNRLAQSNTTNFFNGQMAEVRFYDHALSEPEISELFDGDPVAGNVSHFTGIGATTHNSTKYKARVDKVGATLQIEYSTASDLSGSTTSTGVSIANSNDRIGEEEITGLSANTKYYYSLVVDGERKHSSPFPFFKTFPTAGADADVKILFGSCMDSPTEGTIFPAMGAEEPHLLIHLGDLHYTDNTGLTQQITGYRSVFASDFLTDVIQKMAWVHTWDDHDYADNNSSGDEPGKANSLATWKQYICSHDLENATNGLWRSFTVGNAEIFLLDTRYQREGSLARFPASSTNTADTGSSGTSLVLRAADSPSGVDDNYNSWYVEVEGVVRRVTDYVASTRTCTLSASVPGLDDSSTYYLRRASILDMDGIADDQVDWLIDAVNSSTRRWKIIATSVVWNKTMTGTTGSDSWGSWDTDQIERKYLLQEITADNVVVISADRHGAGIDDGSSSDWPEASASPFNRPDIGIGGTWSQGTDNTGHKYGVLEIDGTNHTLTLTCKDADGTTTASITPLEVEFEGEEPPAETSDNMMLLGVS